MPSLHALGVGTPWPELLVALLQPTLLQQLEAADPDTARVVRRRDASAFARLLHEWQDPPDGFDAAEPPAEWGADDYDDASEYDASEFEDFVDSDEEASEEETGVDEEEDLRHAMLEQQPPQQQSLRDLASAFEQEEAEEEQQSLVPATDTTTTAPDVERLVFGSPCKQDLWKRPTPTAAATNPSAGGGAGGASSSSSSRGPPRPGGATCKSDGGWSWPRRLSLRRASLDGRRVGTAAATAVTEETADDFGQPKLSLALLKDLTPRGEEAEEKAADARSLHSEKTRSSGGDRASRVSADSRGFDRMEGGGCSARSSIASTTSASRSRRSKKSSRVSSRKTGSSECSSVAEHLAAPSRRRASADLASLQTRVCVSDTSFLSASALDEDDLEAPVARCRAATYDLEAANTAVATTALRKASSAARPVARPMASALATSPPPPSLAWNPPPRVVRSATPSRPLRPTATPLGVGARPPQGSVLKSALRPSTCTHPEDDDTAGE